MSILRPALIIAFFAVMMSFLARDHLLPHWRGEGGEPLSTAMLADQWSGKDEWMRISINSVPVGVMRTTSEREGDGFRSVVQMRLDNALARGTLTAVATANRNLEITDALATATLQGREVELAAKMSRTRMDLRLASEGGVRYLELPLRQPVTFNAAVDPLLTGNMLQAGEVYLVEVYDPVWGTNAGRLQVVWTGLERIRHGGDRVLTRRFEMSVGNVLAVVHVDEEGNQLRRVMGFADPGQDRQGRDGADSGPRFAKTPRLIFEWIDPLEARAQYPDMVELPPSPRLTADEMEGENQGEPLSGFGFAALILQPAFAEFDFGGGQDSSGEDGI